MWGCWWSRSQTWPLCPASISTPVGADLSSMAVAVGGGCRRRSLCACVGAQMAACRVVSCVCPWMPWCAGRCSCHPRPRTLPMDGVSRDGASSCGRRLCRKSAPVSWARASRALGAPGIWAGSPQWTAALPGRLRLSPWSLVRSTTPRGLDSSASPPCHSPSSRQPSRLPRLLWPRRRCLVGFVFSWTSLAGSPPQPRHPVAPSRFGLPLAPLV